jgi:hypothetical protein
MNLKRRFKNKNLRNSDKFFQEYAISKNDNGDFILEIYFLVEIRKQNMIKYNHIYKNVWVIKKNGIMYKIFQDKLEALYTKPVSKELRSILRL